MVTTKQSTWSVLSKIDCSQKIEKKNGLSYLSWAWAWGIVKQHFPPPTTRWYTMRADLILPMNN